MFVVTLPWATRLLVDRIAVSLRDRYDIEFSAGRVEFSLRSLSFTLHDVRLATGAVPGLGTVTAKRVNLDLAPAAVRGVLAFDRIEIVDPKVSWSAGVSAPVRRAPGTSTATPLIRVGRVDLVNLDADVSTPSSLHIAVNGLSASLQGDAQGQLSGDVRAERGIRVNANGGAETLDQAAAHVTIGSDGLVIQSLVAGSSSGELRLDGAVGFGQSGVYALNYRGRIDVSELGKWWDRPPPAHGRVELSGSIAGALTDPRLTFDLRAHDFSIGALQNGRLDASGRASLDSIEIETFALQTLDGEFDGRGRIAIREGGESSLLAGEWSLPRLRALASRLNLDPSRLPAFPVSGTTNLSWPGPMPAVGTLAGELHVNLRGPGDASLAVAGRAGTWTLQYRHALAGDTVADVRLTAVLQEPELRQSRLQGVIDVESQDLAALIQQLRESIGAVAAGVDVVRSGQLAARGTVGGSIGEPVVDLAVSATDVSAGDVNAIRIAAMVHADRRRVALKPLTADTPSGHLALRGSIGFAPAESAGEFDLRIDEPGRFLPIAAVWRPTGSIAAKGTWSGPLDRPHFSARVTGEELMANGLRFDRLSGDVEVVGDELLVHDLRLLQETGQLRVDGRYNIRDRALAATVEGRGLRGTLRRLWSPASADPSSADAELENVSVDMHLEGPVLRPSGAMTGNAGSVRLRGRDAGAVVVRAHMEPGEVVLDLEAPRFGTEAKASVALDAPRPWTAQVALDSADVVQALTLLGMNPDILAGSTAALSASAVASGDLDTRSVANATVKVEALDGQVRDQPLSLFQPAVLSLAGSRLTLEPVQLSVGAVSVHAAGSWAAARDTPAEGIAVDLDGRVEDVLEYFSPAIRDQWTTDGPLKVGVNIRGGADVASITGEAVAQVNLEEKSPERSAARAPRARTFSGEVRVALDLRATAFDLNSVEGTIVATTLGVSAGQFRVAQQAPTRVRLEQGEIHIERFELNSPSGELTASGTIGLGSPSHTDVRVSGATSLGLMNVLLPARGAGRAAFDIKISGPIDSPQYEGTIELADASLVLPESRLSIAGWTGRLDVTRETIAASALRGQVNGGDVSLNGTVTRRGGEQASPLLITARNVFLEIPRGLRSELNADLTWRNQSGRAALSGTATVFAEPYTESATAMLRVMSALTRASSNERQALPAWLGDTTVDVALQSNGPLTLENSLGNVDMVPDLHLTGTVSDAGLAGTIAIVDDGTIRVGGRSYRLRESSIVFTPEQGLVPRLNIFGDTRIGDYDVTVRISGPADTIETSLSSNPPLSDRDLQSLVVTGQTAGLTGETANSDAFAVGAVSGDVLGFAGQFVGLDSVTVGSSDDLELVSSDVEPSTRLTVSKRFRQRFELVLSENLDDSELTWVFIYRPRPGYQVRLSSSESKENAVEFRQEVTFGPGSSLKPVVARAEKAPDVVARLTVSGDPGFSASEVREALELREGDRFDVREWSRDRDRIRRFYHDRGYYAVHVTPTRQVGGSTTKRREVTLDYRIVRGVHTELEVTGYPSSARLTEILKQAWNDALLPELLAQDLERATREYLGDEGYLRAHVEVELDNSRAGVERALVEVTPGTRTTVRQITFEGNRAISTNELQALASQHPLAAVAWNDSTPLVEAVIAEYASRGYLAATAAVGDLLIEGDRATLPLLVSEGPLSCIETLDLEGVADVRQQGARAALGLAIGSPFVQGVERTARARLERYFRDRGYRDARARTTARVSASDGRVDLSVTVTEGALYVVRGVRVDGAHSTNGSLVDRAVTIAPGDAAGQSEVAETERRLYGLGTFRAAAVRFEPVPAAPSQETETVDAVIEVQEARKYLLRYGVSLSNQYEAALDENLGAVGVAADVRDRNFLGRGLALGLGAHVDPDVASIRGLFSMPHFGSLPLRTNLSLTLRTENQTSSSGTQYSDDEANLTLEQRWRPRGWLELAWGYSASGRSVAFEVPQVPGRPIRFDGPLASLNTSVVVDHRNSIFDPTRGWLYSTSIQWGLQAIGSDFDYLRTLIRGSYYQPIGPIVLASNARWGRLQPRGGIPPLTAFDIFFKAGGTQTVRGYKQDELSAYDAFGIPLGGTRLAVFNEEVRFPIFRIVKGVLFADAGNTFAERAGFSFSGLETGAGFGLRINTPLAPIRIDIGYPVPGRPGLTGPRWHFSIGQMF